MALYGNSTEEKIWNFFKSKGYTDSGIAGLMGNLQAESGLKSTNMQNSYESSLGHTDYSYTADVDSGAYTNFVHDKVGYGIAQWTYYSRKQGLIDYANEKGTSIGDLETQLEYLEKELCTSYKSVQKVLKSTDSVQEASDIVLVEFENPEIKSDSVKKLRASYSQNHYNNLCNINTSNLFSDTGKNIPDNINDQAENPNSNGDNKDSIFDNISSTVGNLFGAVLRGGAGIASAAGYDTTEKSGINELTVPLSFIKIEASSLARIKSKIAKMKSETEQAEKKVLSAINGLDWEVASKQNIYDELRKIKTRLDKQGNIADELEKVFVTTIDTIIETDRKYGTETQSIFDKIRTIVVEKTRSFVDFVFNNKLWKYISATGFFLEGSRLLGMTVISPLVEAFKDFNWGAIPASAEDEVTIPNDTSKIDDTTSSDIINSNNKKINQILDDAKKLVADKRNKYVSDSSGKTNTATPNSEGGMNFDCSAFTQYLYKRQGVNLQRNSGMQYKHDGKYVSKDELLPGDLVFFDTVSDSKTEVSHVGVYIGDGKFVHAESSKSGLQITDLDSNYYKGRYVGAKRILETSDNNIESSDNIQTPIVENVTSKTTIQANSAVSNYFEDIATNNAAKEHGRGSGTQCVELTNDYIEKAYGVENYGGFGNGKDYYSGVTSRYPDKFERIEYSSGTEIKAGDIISLTGSVPEWGHVAIVKSVNGNSITILEQWKDSGTIRENTFDINSGGKRTIIGIARPKN